MVDAALRLFTTTLMVGTTSPASGATTVVCHAPLASPSEALIDLSIVTPTLDPPLDLLRLCIRSVASQQDVAIEHVLVDGGSTNGAVDLAREHGLRVLLDDGAGQAAAIEIGVQATSGSAVAWLGADDELTPGSAAAALAVLRADPGAGWVYGPCEQLDVDSDTKEVFVPPARLDEHSLAWGNVVAQPGTVILRDAWDRVGGLDSDFHLAMDVDLWAKLLDAGYPGRRARPVLARFRLHAGSKSGSTGQERFALEECRAWARVGWIVPASTSFGRARWWANRHGIEARIPEEVARRLDPELVRRAEATTAVLEEIRSGRAPNGRDLSAALGCAPCRRRLRRALANHARARLGLATRR